MFKKITAFLLCVGLVTSLSACGNSQKANAGVSQKVKVSVTFNALKEFTEAVGKDKVEISTIIPDGTEPHDFEPKAQDLVGISTAQVFIYSGFGMESWAPKAIEAADNKNLIVVEASKKLTPIKNTDSAEIKEHGQYDPHTWLSLKNAVIETKTIKDALVKADPSHKNYYEKNCDDYVAQLESLFTKYEGQFQLLSNMKSIVTGHAAFAYFCRDFGLNQNSVEDVFAEGEPTPKQLSELVSFCKKNYVKTIFAEEMASPDISKTLAKEVGAKVETIYTIESGEDNKTYIERMEDNLSKIYASLSK